MSTQWRAVAIAVAVAFVSASASAQEPPTVDQLIARATTYVEEFVTRFSRVVAEERYVQEYFEIRREGSRGTFLGTPQLTARRRLQADLLLVKPPESREWHVFRDVFAVNDRPVRDRTERLTKLFLEASDPATALEQAAIIAQESVRYSLRYTGTIDHPLLAISFLQRPYRDRFRFSRATADRSRGGDVWIVEFREQIRPTIIRGEDASDIVAIGRYWIEARTGRVLRSELDASSVNMQSRVTTTFAFDESLGIQVPVEMQYRYRRGVLSDEVRGTATYGRFRQFIVRTEEKLQQP